MSGMDGWLDPKWVFDIEPRDGYGLNMVGMRVEHYKALATRLAEAERFLRQQVTDTCPSDWGAQVASFLAPDSAASQSRPLTAAERSALDRAFARSITVLDPGIDATGDQEDEQ